MKREAQRVNPAELAKAAEAERRRHARMLRSAVFEEHLERAKVAGTEAILAGGDTKLELRVLAELMQASMQLGEQGSEPTGGQS